MDGSTGNTRAEEPKAAPKAQPAPKAVAVDRRKAQEAAKAQVRARASSAVRACARACARMRAWQGDRTGVPGVCSSWWGINVRPGGGEGPGGEGARGGESSGGGEGEESPGEGPSSTTRILGIILKGPPRLE